MVVLQIISCPLDGLRRSGNRGYSAGDSRHRAPGHLENPVSLVSLVSLVPDAVGFEVTGDGPDNLVPTRGDMVDSTYSTGLVTHSVSARAHSFLL